MFQKQIDKAYPNDEEGFKPIYPGKRTISRKQFNHFRQCLGLPPYRFWQGWL